MPDWVWHLWQNPSRSGMMPMACWLHFLWRKRLTAWYAQALMLIPYGWSAFFLELFCGHSQIWHLQECIFFGQGWCIFYGIAIETVGASAERIKGLSECATIGNRTAIASTSFYGERARIESKMSQKCQISADSTKNFGKVVPSAIGPQSQTSVFVEKWLLS